MDTKKIFKITFISLLILLITLTIIFVNLESNPYIINSLDDLDLQSIVDETNATFIVMDEENSNVLICEEGTYVLSGTCNNGQIYVKSKESKINIVFDNLNLTSNSCCFIIEEAKKTYLNIKEGTTNSLVSYSNYVCDEFTTTGCIYSKDDLTINGTGSLMINSYDKGIVCKDDLKIVDCNLVIDSNNHGIDSNDSLEIYNTTIKIDSNNDGIHVGQSSDNYITINKSNITIDSICDGISSYGTLGINSGTFTINSGIGFSSTSVSRKCIKSDTFVSINDGELNLNSTDKTVKGSNVYISGGEITCNTSGIKSSNMIYIDGGNISLNVNQDGLNSDNKVIIDGGSTNITCGDDGIHAVKSLEIKSGILNIEKSYEGLESIYITISGGESYIVATDDGININCSPNDNMGGMMSRGASYVSSSGLLKVTNGLLYVNAGGDGLDSNDAIEITGGLVIVDGPSDDGNGPLDYDTTCKVTGGTLIAVGSSGMAQNVTSGQCSCLVSVGCSKGKTLLITDSNGNFVMAYTCKKTIECIVFSSNKLKLGKTYTVYINAKVEGTAVCGYYSSGTISSTGTKSKTFTMTSKIYGSSNGMGGGGMNPGGGGGFNPGGMR